ncbi:MAG: aminotransferase class V-fold PLP-dependent enzyme [Planctomycetota bacterium]|nr:aminotransferase class V-fold PLP-dependent enzyme [Planctomycetota bacterium]
MNLVYLDSNATTKPADEVVEAMTEALRTHWPNASSTHRAGQGVRQQVDLARETIAGCLGCKDREVVFTAGGTEADNLAILGSLDAQPDRNVFVTSRTEHDAVRDTAEVAAEAGAEIIWLPLDAEGVVDCNALEDLLKKRADDVALVSIMWANNETGVIQPIETIGNLCREHGVRFHTDAVQWVGKMPTSVGELPVDLLSFSAHKFHGPKGIGGLYLRRGVRVAKRSIGGAQERDRRGGTENTPGIVGMSVAARLAQDWLATDERTRLEALRDRFEQGIAESVGEVRINSAGAARMWNTSNIAFRRLEADAIVLVLSENGICASAGAACASGSLDPSPVLLAMGVPEDYAHGSIRFSLSRYTTDEEIDRALQIIPGVIERLRASMSAV